MHSSLYIVVLIVTAHSQGHRDGPHHARLIKYKKKPHFILNALFFLKEKYISVYMMNCLFIFTGHLFGI